MSPHQNTSPTSPRKRVGIAIVDGIRKGELELPVMPHVAQKVLQLTNDPHSSLEDLSDLIHSDQSIASHVLRIANSAAYGGSDKNIASLQQALSKLGMKLLAEIAIVVSLQNDIYQAKGFESQIRRLLRHALASASFGREIARLSQSDGEAQFLCGLLHSIGQPICLQLISKIQQQTGIQLSDNDVRPIQNALASQVATKVAVDWKLPRRLQITTVFFRKYATAPSFNSECAATYLSQLLASWALQTDASDGSELMQDPAIAYLGLTEDSIRELLQKKDEVLNTVSSMDR